jgi:hypothetical protein
MQKTDFQQLCRDKLRSLGVSIDNIPAHSADKFEGVIGQDEERFNKIEATLQELTALSTDAAIACAVISKTGCDDLIFVDAPTDALIVRGLQLESDPAKVKKLLNKAYHRIWNLRKSASS